MPSIRDRLVNLALGREKRQLAGMVETLTDFYLAGPFEPPTSPEALRSTLKEYDSALLQDLVNQIEWERMGLQGYDAFTTEPRRVRTVQESRRLWLYDVVSGFIIQLWTDFGFGENVKVVPADDKAVETWEEYWGADRNEAVLAQDHIQELSETLLVDGEVYLAYYISSIDGTVTVRPIDTLEIVDIVTDPDDAKRVLFYKRQWTSAGHVNEALYPDWQPFMQWKREPTKGDPFTKASGQQGVEGVKRADEADAQTTVCIQHLAYKKRGSLRGWPLMTAGAPWSREHRKFRENRASVAASMAMFVDKIKSKAGSRGVEAIRAKLRSSMSTSFDNIETNPPAPAGSTWLENEAATRERMPLNTAAGDAKEDGQALLLMAGLGGGVYPHWLGAGDAYRLATATAMEAPMHRQFSRYKLFWSAQFRRMLKIVLMAAETFGKHAAYGSMEAEVTSDRLIEVDLKMISESVTGLVSEVLQPYFESGQVDEQTTGKILQAIWRVALQALGVDDPDEIATDEGFGIEPEPEEAAVRESGRPFDPRRATRRQARLRARELRKRTRTTRAGRLLREAGWVGMGEAVSHQADYERGLRAAGRGYWQGVWSRADASDAFALTIETGLRWAWIEGLAAIGISEADMTADDWAAQGDYVGNVLQHLGDLLDFIEEHTKAKGGALDAVLTRLGPWENEYNGAMNAAKVAAASDPPLEWELGATENHCGDCATYEGKVYRASIWKAWGAVPQSRSLECHGYNCDCRLSPTTRPLTRGHPHSPTGG